jgi:hypothetical protein
LTVSSSPRLDRGEEAQVVHAVTGEYRPGRGVDEEPGRPGNGEVAVCDAAPEQRVGGGGLLIRVCVEGVAGELGEVLDVRQLSESASALKRSEFAATAGWVRSLRAVAAEPVNKTRSWSARPSRRPAALPASSCTDPSGSRPVSMIVRTTGTVREAVWLAGFTIAGTPARKARASCSRKPQTREVEGVDLHDDAAQRRGEVLADEGVLLAERLDRAVEDDGVGGQLSAALARVGEQGPEATVDVERAVEIGGDRCGGRARRARPCRPSAAGPAA